MSVFVYWTLDSPGELLEPIEHSELKEHIDSEDDVLRFVRKSLSGEEAMIKDVSKHQNGEIQSREIVVNVGHTIHDEERGKMEEPSKECNLSNIEEVIPFTRLHVDEFSLLPEQVKAEKE